MVGYLFAGQGAQYAGMAKDLCEAFPESKAVFDKADAVLGSSFSRLIFEGPQEELTKTKNCQPAILTASVACFEAFKSTTYGRQETAGFVAGLSLGEYSALVAASALEFEDALVLVRQRGAFMDEEALLRPGAMLSVIGLGTDAVKRVCEESHTEVANLNCPGQVVISGGISEIGAAEAAVVQAGARRVIRLEVSGAFHSSLMQGAGAKLAKALEKTKLRKPVIPVVSNVTAKPVSEPQEIRDNLIKQVASSVLWEESMRFMLSKGVKEFFEFGPGKVLKGLMRRIDGTAQVTNIEKKEDVLALAGKG